MGGGGGMLCREVRLCGEMCKGDLPGVCRASETLADSSTCVCVCVCTASKPGSVFMTAH